VKRGGWMEEEREAGMREEIETIKTLPVCRA
jgi:hypothetical protein